MNQNLDDLLKVCQPRLLSYFSRMGVSRADIPDLCQEVYLRIIHGWAGFDRQREFLPWMYTIARNERLRFMNRAARRNEVPADSPEQQGIQVDPAQQAEAREISSRVRKTVEELPNKHREVLILKHYQNCTFAEISKILNVAESTVKSRLYKALSLIERRLG
ncbi:sigma-70 family RNA polymerase sigma factor [bacterium]|jgi:RNA polymerase sigma factor (sigma-70 family)|nr:sigma-70 family RNA polymerase sigma factor [bacterium]